MFMLDTGAVSGVVSSISTLSSDFESLASTVEGFDTDCGDDPFDFAGAKGVIVGNINACGTKVSNTVKVIEKVIDAHTSLQGSMKFEPGSEKKASQQTSSYSSSGSTGYSNSYNNSASYNNYNSAPSTNVASVPTTPVESGPVTIVSSGNFMTPPLEDIGNLSFPSGFVATTTGIVDTLDNDKWENIQLNTTSYLTDSNSMLIAKKYGLPALPAGSYETSEGLMVPGSSSPLKSIIVYSNEVIGLPAKVAASVMMLTGEKPDIWKYGYSTKSNNKHIYAGINQVNCKKPSSVAVEKSISEKIEYNADGYATVDGRYVISCDSYFGEVGDRVQVITSDGVVECVIGEAPKGVVKGELTFLTNESCDGSSISKSVTMSNIKSINNLEYGVGGSKVESSDNITDANDSLVVVPLGVPNSEELTDSLEEEV